MLKDLRMKKLIYLIFVFVMVASISKSESMNFSASVNVKDFFDNSPIGDINSSMIIYVETNTGTFTEAALGKTNSSGSLYLSKTINYTGTVNNYKVLVKINPSLCGYAPTEPIGGYIEYVNYSGRMYPTFKVMLDKDSNEIYDPWELSLAQKFCPNLKLHSGDSGVRPVPVEIMDRNNDYELDWKDVVLDVYSITGQFIGYYLPSQIFIPENIYKDNYPYYNPFIKKLTYIDSNNDMCFSCQNDDYPPQYTFIIPHFEWGNIKETNQTAWYNHWNQKMSELSSRPDYHKYSEGTTYAHLCKHSTNDIVIQYYFFYPFNTAANKHEGDWEHINVHVNSQNPNQASINSIDYYYHHEVITTINEIINETHPRVYVGGFNSVLGISGHGSHGSYPRSGNWSIIGSGIVTEYVDGQGLEIDFNNYKNIVLIPNTKYLNKGNNNTNPYIDSYGNNLNWVIFNSYWGYPLSSPSAGETTFAFSQILAYTYGAPIYIPGKLFGWWELPNNIGNVAPLGPAQQKTWENLK